jgi:ABC-type glycerol-3-phosphate transport system permease component
MAIQRRSVDKVGSGVRYVVLAAGAVLFLVPFYLLLRNGLATEADITSPDWTLFPSGLQWGNVAELFGNPSVPMARSLANSALIAVTQTGLVASSAAWPATGWPGSRTAGRASCSTPSSRRCSSPLR